MRKLHEKIKKREEIELHPVRKTGTGGDIPCNNIVQQDESFDQLPKLFKEVEVCRYFGVSLDTLRRERKCFGIGFVKIGKKTYYTKTHILEYLEKNTWKRRTTFGSVNTGSANAPGRKTSVELGMTKIPDKPDVHLLTQEILSTPN